jgi:catechol 2,3-dioxygenase-like lactoylglutathione lyase family enzyme
MPNGNVKEVVPFLRVSDMERSVRYYVEGLGFTITKKWVPGGKLRWCWLEMGGASMMLQEITREGHHAWKPEGKLGLGVSVVFICEDALAIYRDITSRGITASEPQVGNGMWNTILTDPDGYIIEFESLTETPEETKLSEVKS